MEDCKKHDDQMREWIMCLKTAKEIWDAAFFEKDRYEVHMDAGIIFDLAKEIYHERMGRRDSVLHRESPPAYRASDEKYSEHPRWDEAMEGVLHEAMEQFRAQSLDPNGTPVSDKPTKKE